MFLLLLSLALGDTSTLAKPKEADHWKAYLEDARPYRRTVYSQHVAVTNNREALLAYHHTRDDVFQNAPTLYNPNLRQPYAGPGGVDGRDTFSDLYVYLPEGTRISVWPERVPIAQGGMLPKQRWAFPVGTRFIDVLSSDKGVFEVRAREKAKDQWYSTVLHYDKALRPASYRSLGRTCSECHQQAGASEQYGITVRGDDGCFSFPVLKEGTTTPDDTWPLDNKRFELPTAAVPATQVSSPRGQQAMYPQRRRLFR